MGWLAQQLGNRKPVIAMAHLPALPGSPLHDAAGGMAAVIEHVTRDIEALQAGGVDCIMFGNEGDRPYLLEASPESLAAMTAAVEAVKECITVPFGVDYLWDPVATVAIAVATNAVFAREIFTGVYDSDMGLWQPDAARALRMRHAARPGPGRPETPLQHHCGVRVAGGHEIDRITGRERRLLLPGRRCPGLGPHDRTTC